MIKNKKDKLFNNYNIVRNEIVKYYLFKGEYGSQKVIEVAIVNGKGNSVSSISAQKKKKNKTTVLWLRPTKMRFHGKC